LFQTLEPFPFSTKLNQTFIAIKLILQLVTNRQLTDIV